MGRIILDCDLMRFPNSGLYHYCLNLGNYVNQQLQKEKEELIQFYIPPSEKKSFLHPAQCIIEKKMHRFWKPFLWNCKLWHAPFQSGRIFPPKNSKTKVLLTIHDLNPLHENKSVEEQLKSLQHTQKLIDRSDALVCISEFTKSDVLKHCDTRGIPVHVIHNGTHAVATEARLPKAYHPKRPFLFAMGYVNRKKNFHVLVHLLENTDLELVIAGRLDEADYIQGMKDIAEKVGVQDRLQVLGPVSENDKAWYLKNCLAFTLPSLAEGFGAPVVEAMSFGKPLFLSNKTSLPEIGGDVAFYFQNFDPGHMQSVLQTGLELYAKNGLAQKIKSRATQFDWQQKAKEYIKVYQSLIG